MIHCVSVGEARAAKPLLKALQKNIPGVRIVVTVTTKTGYETAVKNYKQVAEAITYFPWDFYLSVRRFLRKINPDMIIIMETELWPGLLHCAGKYSIPVFLVNARLSEKTAHIYKKLHFFWKHFFSSISCVCAQDQHEISSFKKIGLDSSKIINTGNMKFDNPGIVLKEDQKHNLLREMALGEKDFIVILGSTHGGEEELLLNELMPMTERYSHLRILVVPRHLRRVPEIKTLLRNKNWDFSLRSSGVPSSSSSLIVIDTLGELASLYNIAHVAVIGGTFVPVGGHNILEAAVAGCYPVFGPHMFKQKPMFEIAQKTGGGYSCNSVQDAVAFIERCIKDADYHRESVEKGNTMVSLKTGAVDKTFRVIYSRSYLSSLTGEE